MQDNTKKKTSNLSILILGDQSVGKTSIIKQFGNSDQFDENEYKTTIGIDFI